METADININCETCPLRRGGIYDELKGRDYCRLRKHMSRSFYPAGTTIFEQAESPHGVYCVSSGIVELFKTDRSGIKTESMSLGPGDTFGYETLHSAEGFEAKVIEDARICFYPKYPFYRLLQNSKLFFKNLTRIAIHRGLHERGAIIYDD